MRFHLVDRIDTWTSYESIRARKLTAFDEEFWRESSGGRTTLPRPLVLETLCQAGTWLLMLSSDYAVRAALLSVERAEFDADARPGDVLTIEGAVVSRSDATAVLDGTVAVGDRRVLSATGIMCALIEADLLDDPAAMRRHGARLLGGGL